MKPNCLKSYHLLTISVSVASFMMSGQFLRAATTLPGNYTVAPSGSEAGDFGISGALDFGTTAGTPASAAVQLFYTTAGKAATFGITDSAASFLWQDNLITSPSPPRNKMQLDGNNVLSLYKNDGSNVGVTIDPNSGQIALSGSAGGLYCNGNPLFTASSGGLVFGDLPVHLTNATDGALTVAGDSYIHGLRIGLGGGNVAANTALGSAALQSNTTGNSNTGLGYGALCANLNGQENTATGAYALSDNISGSSNAALGDFALRMNTTGNCNAAIGYASGFSNSSGGNNTFIGYFAGSQLSNGTPLSCPINSVYIGANARGGTLNDSNSIVLGSGAIGEGSNTTVIGNSSTVKTHLFGALAVPATTASTSSTTGALTVGGGIGVASDSWINGLRLGKGNGNIATNTAVGVNALNANTTGIYNTATGIGSLQSNTTGTNNTASGSNSLCSNTTGCDNTTSGCNALNANTTGVSNTAYGSYSLRYNTIGGYNTSSGYCSLLYNSSGSQNSAFGYGALYSNSNGNNNTASGCGSLGANTTGSFNTSSGYYSLPYNTNGTNNTANGAYALNANTVSQCNSAMGAYALYANNGGGFNTAIGSYSGYANVTGGNNVFLGYQAGRFQENGTTSLGATINSIYLGANSRGKNTSDSNSIVIGCGAIGEGANTTVIGNSSTQNTHIYGTLVVNSICSGGSPILTTSSLNVILSGKVSFSGGNAEGGNSTAMSSGNAVGNYTAAMSNGESDGESSTAMSNGVSDGESSTAMSYGSAAGEYSTAMSGAFADGIASTAMSEGYAYADDSTAMSCGYAYGYCSTAMTQGAANGKYSLAAGIDTEADAYSSVSLGSSTHSWGDGNTWIETDPILLVGNGSDDTNRSNAITTLKNGQTTLTNKAWMNRDASVSPTADLSADPAASSGNALVVEGHTVLKGKVIIEQPQGDISMGDYADPGVSTGGGAAY